ncbi:PAS domain S-box protein [Rubellimicrobium arenae]|uniref:PAS domain S-box protein n=1 Tax=Rubellimicrobium arenae TaxID=2817372 RepID=UPI001B31133D|nr:PAS domain S-box protein [Rubellimicrobium arenae]
MTKGRPDAGEAGTRLRRRVAGLTLAAAMPLLAAVGLLGWREYDRARAEILHGLSSAQQVRRAGLEQLAEAVDTHVEVLRAYVERRLDQDDELPEYRGPIDWPSGGGAANPAGGLILADPARLTAPARREISAVATIFALAEATHATRPFLRWSYFFSQTREFVAVYPWAPPGQMIDPATPTEALKSYFAYDLFTMGEPAGDPDRASYWTPVYVDAAGSGLMVTHAAPVWSGGRFRGVVGTDVLLSHISTFLASFPGGPGTVAVVDQQGHLIASPEAGPIPTGNVAAPDQSTDGFVELGSDLVSSAMIQGTPWRLVTTIPTAQVRELAAARVMPFALLLVGILASLGAVVAIFNRQFVGPALALVDFGASPTGQASSRTMPAGLPGPFQPLAQRLLEGARSQAAQTAHLRAMLDGVPLRVAYLDAGLIYRDVNREFLEFLDRPRAEVIGHHVRDILGPLVEREYMAAAPRIERGEISRFEGWIGYAGQGRRFVQVSILPFRGSEEALPGFLTFTRDLTDLKQAEQVAGDHLAALSERENRYRSVVVSALDAIIVMDEDGTTLEFNPAAEAIFGYPAAEAVGRKVSDLIVPPSARAAHNDGLSRYLKDGEPHVIGHRIEVEGLRKDGTLLPVELTVTVVRSGEQRIFVSHLRDLTEAKRLEREMQEGRNRLHQVEKLSAMGSLLAGVAHELNNPLAIVVAQTTLLADKAPDATTRTRAERIRAAADRCGRIVKSFLAMARQKPPERAIVDLREVIRSAQELVAYGLRSAGVEVELRLPETPLEADVDRDLLGQVFSNLLINAQQALTARPLPRRLRVSAVADGPVLRIRVEDNGPGVPEAMRDRIFEPYFTTKAVEVGTGIGLSISRNVVEAHGGSIIVTDGELPGACFEVRLPSARAPKADRQEEDAQQLRHRGSRILVVDDEADVAESLAELLETLDHRVTVATSSESALEQIDAGRFDVVFTDLHMPGLDGTELALRSLASRPQLAGRVILMTGDTVTGPAQAAAAGLPGLVVLEKPFTAEEVAAVMRSVMA